MTGNEVRVQYKYGSMWTYEYRLGDRIELEDGDKATTHFYGITEGPMSENEAEYFRIELKDAVLVSIVPATSLDYD